MSSFAARLASLVFLAFAVVVPAAAPSLADGRDAAIRATILRQLEAFRANDADAAWAIAAPTIQKKFGSKERFMEMVTAHYPQIRRSQSAIFKELKTVDGTLVQRVFVEGGPGDFVDAYYTMALIDGEWRITGVFVQAPRSEGA